MSKYEQRYAELDEEFHEEYHPAHGGNMARMLIEKLIKLEADLLESTSVSVQLGIRAEAIEAENARLWDFHALVLRYWMAVDRPSDKEMYNAIAALDTYRRELEDINVASSDGPEE